MTRLLSLSGGGARGIFQAVVLQRLEEDSGKKINEIFTHLAGTSTGSIIAAAAAEKPMELIANLFLTKGGEIFKKRFRMGPFSTKPKYDQAILHKILCEYFQTLKLGELKSKLLIPASQINPMRGLVFTNIEERRHDETLLADIVCSSCSAPTYFSSHTPSAREKLAYVDGGMWANDPSILLLNRFTVEIDAPDFLMLSVGNGFRENGYDPAAYNRFNTIDLVPAIIDVMFRCQETSAQEFCENRLNEKFKSINVPLETPIDLDDVVRANRDLNAKAHDYWGKNGPKILSFLGLQRRIRN